jgi:hypothetical protein
VHDQRVNVNASALQHANKDPTTMGLIGIKTKYMEDVFIGKHTSVWGSYFDTETKRWGYSCCFGMKKADESCKG